MLTLCIEGRCGLVEEQDARSADEGASDSDPLLLAARETSTALAHLGLEPEREESHVLEEAAARLL